MLRQLCLQIRGAFDAQTLSQEMREYLQQMYRHAMEEEPHAAAPADATSTAAMNTATGAQRARRRGPRAPAAACGYSRDYFAFSERVVLNLGRWGLFLQNSVMKRLA